MTDIVQDPFAQETADAMALFGPRSIAAKFPKVGYVVEGDITGWRTEQCTGMSSGELQYWFNRNKTDESQVPAHVKANPRNRVMQMVISLQCEPTGITWETNQYIEKEIPDDDGMRSLYVSGDMVRALGKALEPHKLQIPERTGAHLKVIRGKSVKKGDFFQFTYAAQYTPAAQNPAYAESLLKSGGNAPEDDPWASEDAPF